MTCFLVCFDKMVLLVCFDKMIFYHKSSIHWKKIIDLGGLFHLQEYVSLALPRLVLLVLESDEHLCNANHKDRTTSCSTDVSVSTLNSDYLQQVIKTLQDLSPADDLH